MDAGRELDRLIAETVFGRERLTARYGLHPDGDIEYYWGYPLGHHTAPAYSTDIEAAWKVVVVMAEPHQGIGSTIVNGMPAAARFFIFIKNSNIFNSTDAEAATLVCNLALEALGLDGKRVKKTVEPNL
jgi:hypothetical protein